jgi:hypothetical protein
MFRRRSFLSRSARVFFDGRKESMKMTKSAGMLVLAIYLILVGVLGFTSIPHAAMVLNVLALIAGILILLGK